MNRIEHGFRRVVAYTVGGVAVLAFALFLRALFMTQSQATTTDSPIQTPQGVPTIAPDPFGVIFFAEEGDDTEPAWSRDGRYIAYTSLRGNTSYLFVRDLTTNSITQIATDAWYPRWSPDGAQLLYERSRPDGNRDTYLTDPQGAQHVKINDTPDAGGAIWSPDGQSILLSTRSGELHVVSRDGAAARVMPVENIWALSLGSVSPDGTQVIGSAATRDSQGLTGLIRIDAQTGRISQQIVSDPLAGSAVLSPDGKTVAYRTSDKDNTAVGIVRAVPASGGEPHTLATPRPGYSVSQYAWSPDSRFIAYVDYPLSSVMDGGEVFVARTDGSQPVALLPGSVARTFSWSPDGTQIAISVKNGGQFDIAIIRADEASLLARQATLEAEPKPGNVFAIQRLTTDPDSEYRLAVSPDGQSVAFARAPAGSFFGWDIYSINLATGETRRLTDSPEGEMSPAWSPDGTRIAYQRMTSTPSGLAAVDWLVISADGSAPVIVSSGPAWSGEEPAAWSPDSNRIAFMDGGSIVVFSLGGPREVARFVPPVDRWFSTPVWLPDGKRVVFAGGDALMIGDVETGEFVPVASAAGFARLPMWSNALSRIAYFDVSDRMDVRLISLNADGSDPLTLARFTSPTLQYPAWSHDGRFTAYLTEDSLRVTVAWTDQYIDRQPLFTLPLPSILVTGPPGTVDLRGVSWLPDSSGFVFVASNEGQPDLYLATLNEDAIQAYLAAVPPVAPTQVPPPTLTFPPTPIDAASQPSAFLTATPTPPGFWLTPTPTPSDTVPLGTPPYWLLIFSPQYGGRVDVAGQHIWITGLGGSSVYSPDGGGTWSEFGPFGTSVTSIEPSAHFEIDRTVYILAGGVIYRSSDGGTSWKPVASNNEAGYTGISVTDDGTIFATSGGRGHCEIHRSIDGGLTWIMQLSDDNCLMARVVASLEYANDGIVYTLTDNRGLWRSRDRGDTWEQITGDNPADLTIDSSNPSTVYMVSTDGDLLRSDNYGDGWLGPLLPTFVTTAGIAPNGTVIVGTEDGRVYKSTDRGTTWAEISTFSGDPIRGIAATDDVIYALTETGLIGGYREGAPMPATPTPTP